MTDREACMSGALLRAVILVRRGWSDAEIVDRIAEDYYVLSERQRRLMVDLARQGVAYCERQRWQDDSWQVNLSQAPQLPPE